jgi:hypothetical protein
MAVPYVRRTDATRSWSKISFRLAIEFRSCSYVLIDERPTFVVDSVGENLLDAFPFHRRIFVQNPDKFTDKFRRRGFDYGRYISSPWAVLIGRRPIPARELCPSPVSSRVDLARP